MAFLILFLTILPARSASAQEGQAIAITSPQAGGVLQGVAAVTGTSAMDGFTSAEVAFSYSGDPTNTWFVLVTSDQPVTDGTLTAWDTTTITDGVYTLRLRVFLAGGNPLEALVPDLRVRNYTPVETATPTQTPVVAPPATPVPTATSTPLPFSTPTPLPPNPAVFGTREIFITLGYGALAAAALFLLVGLYARIRHH